jgi:ribosomal-protein-alanine N-acetyltransferase
MGGVIPRGSQADLAYDSLRSVMFTPSQSSYGTPAIGGMQTPMSIMQGMSPYSDVRGFSMDTETSSLCLSGKTVTLEPLDSSEFAEWHDLRIRNAARLAAMGDEADAEDEEAFEDRCARLHFARLFGTLHMFGVYFDGDLVGEVGITGVDSSDRLSGEVVAWIDEAHSGNGLVIEAFSLLCRHAFEDLELHRLECLVLPDNVAVLRAAEKAGLRHEGLAAEYRRVSGKWRDHERYAITVGEWRKNSYLQGLLSP